MKFNQSLNNSYLENAGQGNILMKKGKKKKSGSTVAHS